MANKHEKPPQVATYDTEEARSVLAPSTGQLATEAKKQRLFYYEDAVEAWIPLPPATEKAVHVEFFDDSEDGDEFYLRIRRFDMTDAQFDYIPEE